MSNISKKVSDAKHGINDLLSEIEVSRSEVFAELTDAEDDVIRESMDELKRIRQRLFNVATNLGRIKL